MNRTVDKTSSTHPEQIPDVTTADAIQPFFLEGGAVRGRLVRLGSLAEAILARKKVGAATYVGGQAISLVAGLSAGLKFQGSLSLQVKGDGPLSLLIADSTHDGALRLYMRMSSDEVPSTGVGSASRADQLFGEGYLAFTIDQGPDTERQQGIVAIEGETLSEMANSYFLTSEQHPSSIHLFSRYHAGQWEAGGLILERIAASGGVAHQLDGDDQWETAKILASTLTEDELFNSDLSSKEILFRLFGTIGVRTSETRPMKFGCRCSREKLTSILAGFTENDLDDMVEEGMITMSCEFCGIDFKFDRAALSRNNGL